MECLIKSSMPFTAIFGDRAGEDIVWPFLYGECGIFDLVDKFMPLQKYGGDLEFILVGLFVEGEHDWFEMPASPRLGRYSKKYKCFGYDVPLTKQTFFCLSPEERKEFFLKNMGDAIISVRARFKKKGLEFDCDTMLMDLRKVAEIYRDRALPAIPPP